MDRLWKCDAQALPYKANGAPRPPATVAAKKPLARRRDPRSSVCRHTSDRRKGSRGAPRTPRLQPVPRRARESIPRQRPTPVRTLPPERGGTHRGGLGTPLEGTYFQAEPGNAICVQSLDDSLNSAIHITYHISLRSSSLREPRYPSTGVVVWVVVSARTDPAKRSRARALWGGVERSEPSDDEQGGRSRSTRAFPLTRSCEGEARPHAHDTRPDRPGRAASTSTRRTAPRPG